MSEKQDSAVLFDIELEGLVQLGIEEIWPNGDAPKEPSAADVAQVMESQGLSTTRLVSEWNLPLEISINGHPVKL